MTDTLPRTSRALSATCGGFTLIELLVVLAILGLLMTLAGPQVLKYIGTSKISTARMQVENLATALDLYKIDVGRYPTGEEGLKALLTAPPALIMWAGPYLKSKNASLIDPWNHPYIYRIPGDHGEYDLFSQEPDVHGSTSSPTESAGTQAITNW